MSALDQHGLGKLCPATLIGAVQRLLDQTAEVHLAAVACGRRPTGFVLGALSSGRHIPRSGTGGSNPLPSTGESTANS
jgi:hypothetical protein